MPSPTFLQLPNFLAQTRRPFYAVNRIFQPTFDLSWIYSPAVDPVRTSLTAAVDGVTRDFPVSGSPNNLMVIWNGLVLEEGVGYTWNTSSSTFTMLVTPNVGDTLVTASWTSGPQASPTPSVLLPVVAKTSAYAVVQADSDTVFTNAGASGEVDFSLPVPVPGMTYTFSVEAAQVLKIVPDSTSYIRYLSSVTTPVTGSLQASSIGNTVTLIAVSITQWETTNIGGLWTVN